MYVLCPSIYHEEISGLSTKKQERFNLHSCYLPDNKLLRTRRRVTTVTLGVEVRKNQVERMTASGSSCQTSSCFDHCIPGAGRSRLGSCRVFHQFQELS